MHSSWQGSTDRQVLGPTGPNRSEISKIVLVLVWSGPKTRTEPLGLEPTGFGPWVPGSWNRLSHQQTLQWRGTL